MPSASEESLLLVLETLTAAIKVLIACAIDSVLSTHFLTYLPTDQQGSHCKLRVCPCPFVARSLEELSFRHSTRKLCSGPVR